jgi:serine/threonine protein kinase
MDDSSTILTLDDDNPWPGLDSYTEEAQAYFRGRDPESAELLRLIRLSPFVALYGKSGLGKTSMLRAGVFPRLRKARFLPVYLRLDYTESAEHPPLAQALARLRQETGAPGVDAAPPEPGEELWAYLQRRERPIWTSDNFPLTPVLVFDQFEEVFSRGGSAAHVQRVLDAIADLVGNRLTIELTEDQGAARRLNLQSQQYRIVLSFRSDFLAEVESWERQASLPKHEALHLKALTRDTAVGAIQSAGAAVLEPGVAAQIVDFVLVRDDSDAQGSTAEVEPVLLSLCCFQLNSRRRRPAKIDGELLKSVGKDILRDFYNEALEGTASRVSVFIEDNLIQGGRYRSSFPRGAAIACGALTDDDLARLTSRRLLRVDPQGDVPRIELIHDRLVGIVREAKDSRLQRERDRREKLGLDAEMMQRLEHLGYDVEERTGEGRIGIVYRAREVAEGREVALKIARRTLERESYAPAAELLGRLNHRGIIAELKVHDEASPAVLAMAWVDGRPITLALNNATWDAKAGGIASVCDVIDSAHRQGVVHGDLKPNNLLIAPDGKPKVLDFGLSRMRADAGDLMRSDSSGAAAAARYLAPEQVGEGAEVGPATDVYALGVVLYELLTGDLPFAAGGSRRDDAPELPMLKRGDVPEPLQRICLKALEKRPEDRYRSMSEMREDLECYRRGKAVPVRPSYYNNLIESPARSHVAAIDRWRDQALITDGEHVRLRRAYQSLTRSGLQAVRESRLVHWRVLSLYLGGWLALDGVAWWLALYYSNNELAVGIVRERTGRVFIGLIPAIVANGLWQFFDRRGSYRFAFAAMIIGLVSLPFAVGVGVHEIVGWLADGRACGNGGPGIIAFLNCPVPWGPLRDQIFDGRALLPNIQLFIAFLVAVVWSTYVALRSRTLTSATIVGLYFVALNLIVLDFRGLKYLFDAKLSYGGFYMLPAAYALVVAAVYVGQKPMQPRQAVPLFAIAMVVAILASQAIAIRGPRDWDWQSQLFETGAIEVALGIVYLACSRYLRDRFRVEAAAAYLVLAWLAPVALLGGIALMDEGWRKEEVLWMVPFLGKMLTPWAPVLLAGSIVIVLLAARVQSYLYIICGLLFLDYSSWVIAFADTEKPWSWWPWPFIILCTGLALMASLTWWDFRTRIGEDIDDVGEQLIRSSRLKTAAGR